jgi:hypothetical protein
VFGEIDDARATASDDLLDPMAGEERADPRVHREVVALRPYGEKTGRRGPARFEVARLTGSNRGPTMRHPTVGAPM